MLLIQRFIRYQNIYLYLGNTTQVKHYSVLFNPDRCEVCRPVRVLLVCLRKCGEECRVEVGLLQVHTCLYQFLWCTLVLQGSALGSLLYLCCIDGVIIVDVYSWEETWVERDIWPHFWVQVCWKVLAGIRLCIYIVYGLLCLILLLVLN